MKVSNLQTRLFNPKYSRKPNHRVNPDPVQMAARIGDTEAALDFHSPNKTYGYDLQALTDEQQQRLIKSAHFERHPILIALRHGHLETARGLYDQAKDSDKERILKYLIFNPDNTRIRTSVLNHLGNVNLSSDENDPLDAFYQTSYKIKE